MRVLITMGLADRSVEHHIKPITAIKNVDKIIIVRDRTGPILDKVVYITPPEWSVKFPILKTIFKFALLLYAAVRYNPDIVHGFLLFPYGLMSYLAGRITGKNVGVSLIAGPVELYTPFGGSPIGKYPYNKPLPKISGLSNIMLYIIRNMEYITTTGSFTRNFLVENKVRKDKIFIMPHVVDDRFKPYNKEKIYDVIYVGRLAKVKHVEILIKAVDIVRRSLPDIRVAIVGDGPEMGDLQLLSKEVGLNKNICFIGYKSNVWDWYNYAKISVVCSEREGFPYSVVEALSCGVPVITTNCGDVTDIVRNGLNGIIVTDYTNYEILANEIINLLNDEEKLKNYSNNASKIKNELTQDLVSSMWESIFSKFDDVKK